MGRREPNGRYSPVISGPKKPGMSLMRELGLAQQGRYPSVAVDRLYRRERFTSERERVEYLVTLYERLRAPLASVAAAKPRRRRRRK